MNVSDGGRQPFMRDTTCNGQLYQMVTEEGTQKGMKTVFQERGVDIRGMNSSKMKEKLQQFEASVSVSLKL